jgi:hypothetical protein
MQQVQLVSLDWATSIVAFLTAAFSAISSLVQDYECSLTTREQAKAPSAWSAGWPLFPHHIPREAVDLARD